MIESKTMESKDASVDTASGSNITPQRKSMQEIIQREVDKLGIIVNTTTREVVKEDGTVETVTRNEFVGFKEGYDVVHKFFATTECWFPGCEDLRKQYDSAVNALGDESCVPCKKGAITRQFVPKVKAALDAYTSSGGTHPDSVKYKISTPTTYAPKSTSPDKNSTNTGTSEVSGPGSKSIKGIRALQKLLRRASSGIKKIFGANKTTGES